MKLLIITQVVDKNHSNLGFFHQWIEELAKYYEDIIVICLQEGSFNLPKNVRVLSLGKEKEYGRLRYILNFYKYILLERKNYNKVFIHMNPEYVLLGGFFWKLFKKDFYLWYTHKQVDWKLRLAEKFVKKVFTASSLSFRLLSNKLVVMGHGIDIEKFKPADLEPKEKIILTVGRLSASKQTLEIVKIFEKVRKFLPNLRLQIIGSPITNDDYKYKDGLQNYIHEKDLEDVVELLGSLSYNKLPIYYQSASLFINLSKTGSLDKAVLEAMACNLPVVTTNEAFLDIVPSDNFANSLESVSAISLNLLSSNLKKDYRSIVVNNHSLNNLIKKLVAQMKN